MRNQLTIDEKELKRLSLASEQSPPGSHNRGFLSVHGWSNAIYSYRAGVPNKPKPRGGARLKNEQSAASLQSTLAIAYIYIKQSHDLGSGLINQHPQDGESRRCVPGAESEEQEEMAFTTSIHG